MKKFITLFFAAAFVAVFGAVLQPNSASAFNYGPFGGTVILESNSPVGSLLVANGSSAVGNCYGITCNWGAYTNSWYLYRGDNSGWSDIDAYYVFPNRCVRANLSYKFDYLYKTEYHCGGSSGKWVRMPGGWVNSAYQY